MPERNNWTVFIIVLLGLGALSLPRTAPDGTPGQSQTRPEVGSASDRGQKVAGSVKHDVKAETLEKVEAALNERETALQKVGEYFGARDLFTTNEDLKDLIL